MYELEKRFCKDVKAPINCFHPSCFFERLKVLGLQEQFIDYMNFIRSTFDTDQDYLEYYNSVKDKAITFIKNSEAFQHLNACDMSQYSKDRLDFSKNDIYKSFNIGSYFISIDMKKANFTALVHYAKENGLDFFDSYNYDDFISKFTEYSHIRQSKYIRQVIFGNCNPKRQISYETFLMTKLLKKLISACYIRKQDVYAIRSDEIIIKADDLSDKSINFLRNFILEYSEENFPLSFEYFRLGKIVNTEAFIKDFDEGKYELKCVNPIEAPFIYRYMNYESFNNSDFLFEYNGKLAKLLEKPDLSISYQKETEKVF